MLISVSEYAAMLRRDFLAFIERVFYQLNPSKQFHLNWHIELMAEKLMDCVEGRCKRLIINLPPRYMKSICATVALPAFWLARDPWKRFICISYAQDLSEKHAIDRRQVMRSPWYQRMTSTRLSPTKQAVNDFATTAGGGCRATSVNGVLTGLGADVLILDDPLKPTDALSEAKREGANHWLENTAYSRLDDKQEGCIIIVTQRLHLDDLVGYVLKRGERWEVVSFPAIAEEEQTLLIRTLYGTRTHHRKVGDVLHAQREPRAMLEQIRQNMNSYNFAGQYQQTPSPLGGGMVKEAWFRRYDLNSPPPFEYKFQSWDTGGKEGSLNNPSVGLTFGVADKKLYLCHVFRAQVDYPNLKRAVKDQQALHNARDVVIEDAALGMSLIPDLRAEGFTAVRPVKPSGDKVTRMSGQSDLIENGLVYLPTGASWLDEYIREVTTFPMGKFDDQVDATSQALAWFKESTRRGIFEYWFPPAETASELNRAFYFSQFR